MKGVVGVRGLEGRVPVAPAIVVLQELCKDAMKELDSKQLVAEQ